MNKCQLCRRGGPPEIFLLRVCDTCIASNAVPREPPPLSLEALRAEYAQCIENCQQEKEVPSLLPEEWHRYWISRAGALGWVLDRVDPGFSSRRQW